MNYTQETGHFAKDYCCIFLVEMCILLLCTSALEEPFLTVARLLNLFKESYSHDCHICKKSPIQVAEHLVLWTNAIDIFAQNNSDEKDDTNKT